MSLAAAATASLRAGDLAVDLHAGAFLSVTSLRDHDAELLVGPAALPTDATVHGQAAGVTLLHPWANRLGSDRYRVAGVPATVADGDGRLHRDANGLALHGLAAAPGAWRLEAWSADRATAALRHEGAPGSPFPFPHDVEVLFALRAGRLEVTTSVHAADVAVPVAFGWHPYLRLPGTPRAAWRLALPSRRHLTLDDTGLPSGKHCEEPADERPLARRALDDGYDALADGAWMGVRDERRRLRVRLLHGYPAAQVFAPPAVDVVSLEPMTAPTNALVTGRGLRMVAPGAAFAAAFAIDVRGYPGRR
jgi:galactose mutarotase-like enzyme